MISHHLPLFALPRTRHLTVTFLYSYSHQEHLWHLPIASFFLYLVNDAWQGQCASYKKVIGVRHVAEVSGTHLGMSGARQAADSIKNWNVKQQNHGRSITDISKSVLTQFTLYSLFNDAISDSGTRGRAVGWGTALQTGRSRVRFIGIFHWHNPSGRTVALGSTQSVTEMSTMKTS